MKILIFSDLHAHNYQKYNTERLNNCLLVIYQIYMYAINNGIKNIIHAGDLFDQQKSVPTEVFNSVFEMFKACYTKDIAWYLLSGNHDLASNFTRTEYGITSITPLFSLPNIFSLDFQFYDLGETTISGIPYIKDASYFKEVYNTLQKSKLIFIHQTPPNENTMIKPDVLLNEFDNDHVFCGHIHTYQSLSSKFTIIGSPLHRDLGDEGQDKGFLVYDTTTNTYERILLDFPKFTKPKVELVVSKTKTNLDLSSGTNDEILTKYASHLKLTTDYIEVGKSLIS